MQSSNINSNISTISTIFELYLALDELVTYPEEEIQDLKPIIFPVSYLIFRSVDNNLFPSFVKNENYEDMFLHQFFY